MPTMDDLRLQMGEEGWWDEIAPGTWTRRNDGPVEIDSEPGGDDIEAEPRVGSHWRYVVLAIVVAFLAALATVVYDYRTTQARSGDAPAALAVRVEPTSTSVAAVTEIVDAAMRITVHRPATTKTHVLICAEGNAIAQGLSDSSLGFLMLHPGKYTLLGKDDNGREQARTNCSLSNLKNSPQTP